MGIHFSIRVDSRHSRATLFWRFAFRTPTFPPVSDPHPCFPRNPRSPLFAGFRYQDFPGIWNLGFGIYSFVSNEFLRVNNFSRIILEISLTGFLEIVLMQSLYKTKVL